MGDIALTAAHIAPVYTDPGHCTIWNAEAGEAITAGQILCWDTDGQLIVADGNQAARDEPVAVALQAQPVAGMVLSVLSKGPVYGFTVAGINTGVILTLSDNIGAMEEAGTGEHCARVWALPGGTTADYVAMFDFDIPAASV